MTGLQAVTGERNVSDFELFERYYTENFSTALVVFAARQSPVFAKELLKLILCKAGCPETENYAVSSIERNFPIQIEGASAARLPDICMLGRADGERCRVLIEAKIGAVEGPDQLADYRAWLGRQEEKKPWKVLATLTRHPLVTKQPPDVALSWSDIIPLIDGMFESGSSQFERGFWTQFRNHLEVIMSTFNGFSADFSGVHQLMREVDSLLISLLNTVGVTPARANYHASHAAYDVPEWGATVGFYWWRRFGDPADQDTLVVWKDGKPMGRPVDRGGLKQVVDEANAAKREGRLAE